MDKNKCPVDYGVCEECIYFLNKDCKYRSEEYPNFCFNCGIPTKKDINLCSKKCESIFREESRKENEAFLKDLEHNNKIIEEAKKLMTEEYIEELNEDLENMDYITDCKIVDMPCGEKQSSGVYVTQTSIGDSGDCFTGNVFIPLSNGKYLRYYYDC